MESKERAGRTRIENDTYDLDALWDFCRHHQRLYIYGNGEIGKRVYKCIEDKGYAVSGFLVTKKDCGKEHAEDVHAFSAMEFDEGCGIILGMKREYREAVMDDILSRVDDRHVFMPMG